MFGLAFDVVAGLMLAGVGLKSPIVWVLVAEIPLVLASTTAIPAATADMAMAAPPQYAASAQGALNAARQAGAALGVALLGTLTSLHVAGAILAGLSVVALAISVRRLVRKPVAAVRSSDLDSSTEIAAAAATAPDYSAAPASVEAGSRESADA